jgi:hypothetical protein
MVRSPSRQGEEHFNVRGRIPQRVAIPAYAYPYPNDPNWRQILDAAPSVSLIVADPADGPGTRPDPNYTSAIARAREQDISVLGYVTSSYGARPNAEVQADVERWYTWYEVDGIFVDLVSTSTQELADCQALFTNVKQRTGGAGLLILNPGTQTLEAYMRVCDILVNSESSWPTYRDRYAAPAWIDRYAAHRFWHLVHDCPTERDMHKALQLARTRNAGWIYVTDWTGDNAYERLPAGRYWAGELERATAAAAPTSRARKTPPPAASA